MSVTKEIPAISSSNVAKPDSLDDGPQQPHRGRAHAEGNREPHAAHARAHPIVDVTDDHRVGERNRAEHHDHERDLQRVKRPAARARGGNEQRRLQRDDAEIEPLHRKAIDQQPDGDLRERRDDVDARKKHPEQRRIADEAREALAQQLAVAVGREIEQQARRDRGDRHDGENACERRRAVGSRRSRTVRGRRRVARREPGEGDAAGDRKQRPERRTPRASPRT